MTLSVDVRPPADPISAHELVSLMQNPEQAKQLHADLAEVRAGLAALAAGRAELQAREDAAAAKMAEALKIKTTFEARAAGLAAVIAEIQGEIDGGAR